MKYLFAPLNRTELERVVSELEKKLKKIKKSMQIKIIILCGENKLSADCWHWTCMVVLVLHAWIDTCK